VRAESDEGMTLVELLISMAMSVILIGVLGARLSSGSVALEPQPRRWRTLPTRSP
jgi:prepilin-type N-terminal cleavage/methylation domain-containing protein